MKLQLITRRVTHQQAGQWIRQALSLLRHNPVLIGITCLMYLLILLVTMLPAGPLISVLLMPIVTAGFYQCVVDALQKKTPVASTLFSVFQQPQARQALLTLGAVRVACVLPLMLLPQAVTINAELQQFNYDPLALLLVVAYFSFYTMLFAYAEAIIYFLGERNIMQALRASLDSCWKNVLPLTVYGALLFGGTLLAMLVISLVSTVLMPLGMLLFLLCFVVLAPTAFISFFLSFRDCFVLTPAKTEQDKAQDTFEV